MPGCNKLVYVGDDDAAVREYLGSLFISESYEITTLQAGHEILKLADCEQAACVLLDIEMSLKSGWEVLRQLTVARPNLPVIVMSAHNGPRMRAQAVEAGAIDCLAKPVLSDALFRSVSRAFALIEAQKDGQSLLEDIAGARLRLDRLSQRERVLFEMLISDRTDKFVASSQGLGILEVYKLRDNIMEKMEAHNLTQLKKTALLCDVGISHIKTRNKTVIERERLERERLERERFGTPLDRSADSDRSRLTTAA